MTGGIAEERKWGELGKQSPDLFSPIHKFVIYLVIRGFFLRIALYKFGVLTLPILYLFYKLLL
jgi:hypothetical protein